MIDILGVTKRSKLKQRGGMDRLLKEQIWNATAQDAFCEVLSHLPP